MYNFVKFFCKKFWSCKKDCYLCSPLLRKRGKEIIEKTEGKKSTSKYLRTKMSVNYSRERVRTS